MYLNKENFTAKPQRMSLLNEGVTIRRSMHWFKGGFIEMNQGNNHKSIIILNGLFWGKGQLV